MSPRHPVVALLLVEHEATVRGYLTLVPESAVRKDATALLAAHEGPLQVVMGTVGMRFVSGAELASVLCRAQPSVPVIALSAHQWYRALREGRVGDTGPLFELPFDPEEVHARIAALRDNPAAA
jgi:DNA-binding response OmpR family regulator